MVAAASGGSSTIDRAGLVSVALEVDDREAGTRLDVLLVRRLEGMSRAVARRMIQDG